MNIKNSIDAMYAWAIEVQEELEGEGLPKIIIKLLKKINSEGRSVEYRGAGIKKFERRLENSTVEIAVNDPIVSQDRYVLYRKPGQYSIAAIKSEYEPYEDLHRTFLKEVKELRKSISSVRGSATQIINMFERIEGKIPKSTFRTAQKYTASMVNSLKTVLNFSLFSKDWEKYCIKEEYIKDKFKTTRKALINEGIVPT